MRASRPRDSIVPNTIYLEETSRILSADTDIERVITYARQSKLSLVLILQSMQQAYEVFGNNVADTIFENVTQLTLVSHENRDPKYLYYTVNENEYIFPFDPKFTETKDLYLAELEYQHLVNQYASVDKTPTEVALYDHYLYSSKKEIALLDTETMTDRSVKYNIEDESYKGYFCKQLEDMHYHLMYADTEREFTHSSNN